MSKFYAFYPPSGGVSSNASVGPNGDTAPTSSTLIGGVSDVDGTLVPAHMNADGALDVSDVYVRDALSIIQDRLPPNIGAQIPASSLSVVTATGFTVPVSAASLPLPAGAATSALQTTGNTTLGSINTKTPSLGQAVAASSVPVVLASDQTLPLPTGAATETTLAALNTKVPSQGQKVAASSLPVVLASDQTLPLPSGAATETTLAALNTKTPALGQAVMASSRPVVISSDQTAVPVSQKSVVSTVNSSTTPLGVSGVFTGTSENVQDYASIEISVFADQASAALGLSIQQSSNGTNWDILDTYTVPASTGKTYSIAPAARFFRIVYTNSAVAQTSFRLMVVFHYVAPRSSTHSLAEVITLQNDAELTIAQLRATNGANSVPMIADASGNLGVGVATINGVAPLMGAGPTGTGSLRTTIATTTTATLTSVASSITSVTILAANTNRRVATIYNDSTSILYLAFAATASSTAFTVLVGSGYYYELPGPAVYAGIITGVWSIANGSARITEVV